MDFSKEPTYLVVGFEPGEGSTVEEAREALEIAAEAAGAELVRRWEGGEVASYAVFSGLESLADLGAEIQTVNVLGSGRIRVDGGHEPPAAFSRDFSRVGPLAYGEIQLCPFGCILPGHEAPCPMA